MKLPEYREVMQNSIINKLQVLCVSCSSIRRKLILPISLLIAINSFAQTHSTFVSPGAFYTRYGKTAVGYTNAFIPYVSATAGSYYAELRYNYDYDHTLGIYAGKTYYLNKDSTQSLIPQVGWLSGDIHAGSLQAYYILNTRKLFIEFDNQFSFLFNNKKNIYYNWLSASYHINSLFSAGAATQWYVGPGGNYGDNGLFVSFAKGDYVLSLYDFDAYDMRRHYIAVELWKDITFISRRKANSTYHSF